MFRRGKQNSDKLDCFSALCVRRKDLNVTPSSQKIICATIPVRITRQTEIPWTHLLILHVGARSDDNSKWKIILLFISFGRSSVGSSSNARDVKTDTRITLPPKRTKRTNVSKITARTGASTRKLQGLVHVFTRCNSRAFRPVPVGPKTSVLSACMPTQGFRQNIGGKSEITMILRFLPSSSFFSACSEKNFIEWSGKLLFTGTYSPVDGMRVVANAWHLVHVKLRKHENCQVSIVIDPHEYKKISWGGP